MSPLNAINKFTITFLLCTVLISCGGSSPSTSASPGPDQPPAANKSVTLNWSSPVEREDNTTLAMSEISGYRIYYGTDANNLKVLAVITDNLVTQYTTDSLDANTYYFAVTTYDIYGSESIFSNIESKIIS